MRLRSLSGLRVPIVGQGTWAMEQDDRAETIRAIRRGIDLGMTHVDTAEMYGSGRVEEIVGEAIRDFRDRVFLVSKVLPSNASYEGTLCACERSLSRLGTDRLDLYLLHWRNGERLEETFRAFGKLKRDGKIRAFGVSNFDVADLDEAWGISGEIACNQVLYHVQERAIEHAVIPWCESHGVAVVAYSPLGAGRFPASDPAMREIAAAHGVAPHAVALSFLARRESVFVIPKAARFSHVEEDARAGDLLLSDAEARRLSDAFPPGPPRALPTA